MQAAIPVDEAAPAQGPCRWCQEPTTLRMTVSKARYRTSHTGDRVVARAAVQWWACDHHMKTVAREDLDA